MSTPTKKHLEACTASGKSQKRWSSGMKLERTGTLRLHATSLKVGFSGEYAEFLTGLYVDEDKKSLEKPLISLAKRDVVFTPEELVEFIIFIGYRPANEHEVRIFNSFKRNTETPINLVYFDDEEEGWRYFHWETSRSDSIPQKLDSLELFSGLLEYPATEYGILLIRK